MDAKRKLSCVLLLKTFKQHIDSYFQYLSDNVNNTMTIQYMTLEEVSYH